MSKPPEPPYQFTATAAAIPAEPLTPSPIPATIPPSPTFPASLPPPPGGIETTEGAGAAESPGEAPTLQPPFPPPPETRAVSISSHFSPIPKILDAFQTHILSGSSGAGKTSLISWFAGRLLRGEPILGHPTNPPPFMAYIAGDRTISDALHKLESGGWPSPPYYSLVDDPSPTADAYVKSLKGGALTARPSSTSLTFFQHILKDLAERYCPGSPRIPRGSLLWIDGMAPFFGIEPAGSYLKVAGPLLELARFCKSFGVTIILISHASKQMGSSDSRYTRLQDRILGSMALQGFTSTQLFLCEPELSSNPDSGLHEFFWRSHSAAAETFDFRRGPDGVFELVGPHWDVPPQQEAELSPKILPANPALTLLPYIPEEWIAAKDLQASCPEMPKTTYYRYLEILVEGGLVAKELRSRAVYVRRIKPLES